MSVFELESLVKKLKPNEKELFHRIYEVTTMDGQLKVGKEMQEWVEGKFGSAREVEHQKIVKIINRVTGEGSLYNHLRGKRPLPRSSSKDIDTLVNEYREDCPFCSVWESTPADVFGRVTGKHCLTGANLAKYDGYHGLVIPYEHHPLKFDREMVADYFHTAGHWFQEINRLAEEENPGEARYPFLMWNCLWPAGSSVVHGHLQLTVTRKSHYPGPQWMNKCSREYKKEYGSNYFDDIFHLHRALGLGWTEKRGKCRIFTTLTPIKEKETWVTMPPGEVNPEMLSILGEKIAKILRCFIDRTATNSFNAAVYLHPLSGDTGSHWDDFPVIARIVDRGSVFNRTADFGAMELYAASVVSSDPFLVSEILQSAS